ncbi:hypothetical protein [Burkholderia gladioli]|nr:hypothetical protein [Burkholderia gladioli]AJW98440.1 putative phage DNA-binding protein [Burkholderia gladioli]ASD79010.1 DNA-binding protein [Burkholderia gladioli pv. gladioli]AWY55747.1 DNA-binding protein [Burkholderia gladioli pv. gladioli]MBU9272917.1 DNA-binding protein [Burkholderia gladioli]SPV07281.1 phage DNA-binding protein [Burkholderia gladioli]
MSTVEFVRKKPSMQQAFREALTDPDKRGPVQTALKWDDTQVSRFLGGSLGITIDRIDTAIQQLDLRVVSRRYLEAHATLAQTGLNCACAREGYGDCGIGG